MFWGIVHRTILIELLKIFSLALVAITGLILLAGIVSEAARNGFGPAQILAIIPLLLPSLLPYTVPPTTLFATCIVYGRLSADNEILALKSAGVHLVHVIWPALFLGLAASAMTMFLYLDIIPATGSLMRNRFVGDVEELLYMMLRKDGSIRHPKISIEIDVKNVQGRKLQDAIFKRRAADGKGYDIAHAKEAELRVDLSHRRILVNMRHCQVVQANGAQAFLESQIWPVDIPDGVFGGNAVKHRAMDMTWSELFEYRDKSLDEIERRQQEVDLRRHQHALAGTPADKDAAINTLEQAVKFHGEQVLSIEAEMHMRPALALGCLCFALVGCPVGIWFSKSDYLSAFITCFLPIVIIYYPLMLCLFDMARTGVLPPLLSIFAADALMLFIGWILFWRLARN